MEQEQPDLFHQEENKPSGESTKSKLNLTRPIAFFDLETTGVNVGADRIVEYSFLKIMPDGSKEIRTEKINPGMPIPPSSSAIHGIYDKDVADKPLFKDVAHDLNKFLDKCDLAGYNSNKFDVPLLVEEFLRAEVDFDVRKRKLVDVQNIFHKKEQRTLAAAHKFYCGTELINAHSAEADNMATYNILEAQIEHYDDLENDINFLSEFSTVGNWVDLAGRIVFNEKDEEVFNFGKYKNMRVTDVFAKDPSYYKWMMDGDFPLSTKKILTELRLRGRNSA